MHKLVGRINGRYSTLAHTPIRYLDQPVDFVELCALYFLADIAMITSLREGSKCRSMRHLKRLSASSCIIYMWPHIQRKVTILNLL